MRALWRKLVADSKAEDIQRLEGLGGCERASDIYTKLYAVDDRRAFSSSSMAYDMAWANETV